MEAVGRLAGGVAHDFNNLLLVIGGNLQEVLDDPRLSSASREAAREAAGAVERAASLTRQLLSFSRRELVAPRAVDLNEIVESMESLIRRLVGEHIHLTVVTDEEPAVVRGDRGQFEQVLINLAVNARDAMPEGGALEVRVETRRVDADDARRMGLEQPGLHHVLVVCDTGVGVDPRAADHIFEPFYTTKEPGEGTGLGLSIVYNVAHQAGGMVRVLGEQGDGATFEVVLPAGEALEDERLETPADAATPARGRLLLVEDEPAVRRLVTRMLERHGYDVRVAEDGEAALALATESGADFDLLITDVVMPGMGGPELARRVRAELPGLSVLFVSGYPRDYRPGEAPSEDAFLSKPFTQDQLLRAVADQLGAWGSAIGG
jgi:CheY-like chemotaxis protein